MTGVTTILLVEEGKCQPATGDGLPVFAQPGPQPADEVEDAGLPPSMAGSAEQPGGLFDQLECLGEVSKPLQQLGPVYKVVAQPAAVARLPVAVFGLTEVGVGFVELAQPKQGTSDLTALAGVSASCNTASCHKETGCRRPTGTPPHCACWGC
jgi:hypothetical protein